jgi:tripartite-type tricarboxylate transporter receptor subunit TctC
MNSRRILLGHAALAALAMAGVVPRRAWAQPGSALAWPHKPIRIVVGFPAGTSPDLMARALAEPLAHALGQAVIVENRAGASGSIGAEAVAKASDGHTFGLIGNAALTANPILYPKLPYSVADFAPITVVGSAPLLVVAATSVKFDTPAQFFEQARQAGSRWSYGSVGVGSGTHLCNEMLMAKAGFSAVHVPFNGAAAVLSAMIAGDVHMATLPIGAALAQVNAGRVRGVALTSATRSILAPNMPALPEAGVAALNVELWNAVMAPAAMPKVELERFSQALARTIRADDLRGKLFQQGWRAEGTSPEALRTRIKDDTALYAAIITQRRITVAG